MNIHRFNSVKVREEVMKSLAKVYSREAYHRERKLSLLKLEIYFDEESEFPLHIFL